MNKIIHFRLSLKYQSFFSKYILLFFFLLNLVSPEFVLAQRKMENLDRGLVAMKVNNGVFVSWRVLGNEFYHTGYNLYRNGSKIASFSSTDPSNYSDASGSVTSVYQIKTVENGVEVNSSISVNVWSDIFKLIPVNKPATGVLGGTYEANECSTADLDGDGMYELVLKWQPSNFRDNSESGMTDKTYLDAYELDGTFLWRIDLGMNIRSGSHYTQFMVYDLDGDGKAEVVCKTAPGTKDGSGSYLTGTASGANHTTDYRNVDGRVLSGPEYLTVFNGKTGVELQTIDYEPGRGTISEWGDDYGNRCDRFLACVAYLNGKTPNLVMTRGYYGKTVLVAYKWTGSTLDKIWKFDSTENGNGAYAGQGTHNISVADVDNDGFDEIIYGSCTIDHDGTGKYSTNLEHGDALHVGDLDPDRPGLEVWQIHEDFASNGGVGASFRDAKTGEIIFFDPAISDIGRGLSANFSTSVKGEQFWSVASNNLWSVNGDVIGTTPQNINPSFTAFWDANEQREIINGSTCNNFTTGRVMTFYNYGTASHSNGSKYTPALQADILGDWREELIYRSADNTNLVLFSTSIPTTHRIYSMMHDPVYRLGIAWQNVAYNQPPHTGYYIGTGMGFVPPSAVTGEDIRWYGNSANWDVNSTQNWLNGNTVTKFQQTNKVLFDQFGLSGTVSNTTVNISGTITPGAITVSSSIDYIFSGTGSLSGTSELVKNGSGKLTINNANSFSGLTTIWDGMIILNGSSASQVTVNGGIWGGLRTNATSGGRFGGYGTLQANLIVNEKGAIIPGDGMGSARKLTINGHVTLNQASYLGFDMKNLADGIKDTLQINGDLTLNDSVGLLINQLSNITEAGDYPLITYSGTLTGNPSKIKIYGLDGIPCSIYQNGKTIGIRIRTTRSSAYINWLGANDIWDLANTQNWIKNGFYDSFVAGDSVIFDGIGTIDSNLFPPSIIGEEESITSGEKPYITDIKIPSGSNLPVNGMLFNAATADFTVSGAGSISGTGGLTKNGAGKLTINNKNSFTGLVSLNGGVTEVSSIKNKGLAGSLGKSNTIRFNGGTLKMSYAANSTNRDFIIDDGGAVLDVANANNPLAIFGSISGNGALVKNGPGELWLSSASTLAGGLTINEGNVLLMNGVANASGFGSGSLTLNGGSITMSNVQASETVPWNINVPLNKTSGFTPDGRCTLTGRLSGAGTLNILTPYVRTDFKGDWSAFTGNLNFNADADGGDFRVYNAFGYANAAIHFGELVSAYRSAGTGIINIGELTGVSSSKLSNGEWNIGTLNTDATYQGNFTNLTGLSTSTIIVNKVGTGVWTLTSANKGFTSGSLRVNAGKVVLNGSLPNVSVPVSVAADAVLAGSGSIAGETTINGSLEGSLTFSSTVKLNPGARMTVVSGNTVTLPVLELKSDVNGTATLVNNGNVSVTSANVQQYLPSSRSWYITPPVAGSTVPVGSTYYYYDETQLVADADHFIPVTQGTTMTVGRGYIAQPGSATTLSYSGTLNDGNIPVTITRSNVVNKAGFNLIGNPYPSFLNWKAAYEDSENLLQANVSPTIWYRTKNASGVYKFGTYGALSNLGTNVEDIAPADIVTGNIPPMQAFWVRVNSGKSNGVITFKNSMRSHKGTQLQANGQTYTDKNLRAPSTTSNSQTVLRLKISNGINDDEAIVFSNQKASDDLDAYDSPKMSNANIAIPEIYTLASNENVAINGLNSFSDDKILPLGFTTGEANTFTIKASEMINFDSNLHIILRDNLLNKEMELSTSTDYSFNSDVVSDHSRFIIKFKNREFTTETNSLNQATVFISKNENNHIYVDMNELLSDNMYLNIFNSLGKSVFTQSINARHTEIKNAFSPDVYIVKVYSGDKIFTSKIIIEQ